MLNDADLAGAPVYDADGQVGHVVAPPAGTDADETRGLWISFDGADHPVLIPPEQIGVATPDRVSLATSRGSMPAGDGAIHIPLHEETLEATTHQIERGKVLVHKSVETAPYEQIVTTGRDDVAIARVPVGQIVDREPRARWDGDTLIVPLVEEVLVVEKRLRLREELRITRRRVEEQQTVRDTLRRETARVETEGDVDIERAP